MLGTGALRFVVGQGRRRAGLPCRRVLLPLGGPAAPRTPCDVFEPPGRRRGTILTIHGMSPLAQRDPRFLQLNRSVARAGFRVVSPLFRDVAALRIDPREPERMAGAIQGTLEDPILCPSGRLSVLSVSFSGGLALVAAADPRVADRVDAVCTVGAYGHIASAVDFLLLSDADIDDYGRLVVLANFIERSIGPNPDVVDALYVAALDNWHQRAEPLLPEILGTLSEADRTLVHALMTGANVRAAHWERIRAAVPEILAATSVVDRIGGLRARAVLVHGAGDEVIPASESVRIARRLAAQGTPHHLHVTPLISHGDSKLGASAALHAPGLVRAFGRFFAAAAGARR